MRNKENPQVFPLETTIESLVEEDELAVESKKRWPEKKNLENRVLQMPREVSVLRKEYEDEISFLQVISQILVKYTNSNFITEEEGESNLLLLSPATVTSGIYLIAVLVKAV